MSFYEKNDIVKITELTKSDKGSSLFVGQLLTVTQNHGASIDDTHVIYGEDLRTNKLEILWKYQVTLATAKDINNY